MTLWVLPGCTSSVSNPPLAVSDEALGAADHPGKKRLIERCEELAQACYRDRDLAALQSRKLQWKGIPTQPSDEDVRNWRKQLPWTSASAGKMEFLGPFARVEWTEKQDQPSQAETYSIYWILEGGEWFLLPWSLGRAWPDPGRCMVSKFLLAEPGKIELKKAGGRPVGARTKGPPSDALAVSAFDLLEEACVKTQWLVVDAYVELLSDPSEGIRKRAHRRLVDTFKVDHGYDSIAEVGGRSAKWVNAWEQWLGTKFWDSPRTDGSLQVQLPLR